jgi:hypothetical protein
VHEIRDDSQDERVHRSIANGLDRKITGIDRLEAEPNAMCAIGS